jgi:hypothetical protein
MGQAQNFSPFIYSYCEIFSLLGQAKTYGLFNSWATAILLPFYSPFSFQVLPFHSPIIWGHLMMFGPWPLDMSFQHDSHHISNSSKLSKHLSSNSKLSQHLSNNSKLSQYLSNNKKFSQHISNNRFTVPRIYISQVDH